MTIQPNIEPEQDTTAGDFDDGDLCHSNCPCDPDTALCGADISGPDWVDVAEHDARKMICVVCEELAPQPCQHCGNI